MFLWPEESSAPQDAEFEGRIIGFSDSGSEPRAFAVVEVVKTQTLIVLVRELEVIDQSSGQAS